MPCLSTELMLTCEAQPGCNGGGRLAWDHTKDRLVDDHDGTRGNNEVGHKVE